MVKLPKQVPFNIGDKVMLNLKEIAYDGISLRGRIIRDIIRSKYEIYKYNKLDKNIKISVLQTIAVLDKCEYGTVLGVEASGNLCFDYSPCNICYVNDTYDGLGFYKYKILVHAVVETWFKTLNDIQYTIPDMCWGISKINLMN